MKKYLPLFVFFVWMAALVLLLLDNNFQLFLKPSFKGLVAASLVISFLLFIGLACHIIQSNNATDHKYSWLNGIILLIPVLFMFFGGQNTLGEYAMQKRSLAASVVREKSPAAEKSPVEKEISLKIVTPEREEKNKNADSNKDISISTLIREFDRFDGRQVSIQGLYATTVSSHDELSAVFRYLVTCCVADAQPVGVFVSSDIGSHIKNNQWVRAAGQVELRNMDGFDVIFMDAKILQPIEQPDKKAVYLYY